MCVLPLAFVSDRKMTSAIPGDASVEGVPISHLTGRKTRPSRAEVGCHVLQEMGQPNGPWHLEPT